jgi:hypothetical protein
MAIISIISLFSFIVLSLIIHLYSKNKSIQTIVGISIRFSCLAII